MRVQVPKYTAAVITLPQEKTVHDAVFLMLQNDIKRIVVVKENIPIGIVTERDIGRFLEHDTSSRALDKIRLEEVMSQNVVTINEEQEDLSIQAAIRMVTFQISSVIVINENGALVGIITKSDIAKNFAQLYRGTYRVRNYMSKKLMTCRKSDSLLFALNMLNKSKISRLVVTDNEGKAVGIISYDTFLRNSGYFKAEKTTRDYLLPSTSAKNMTVGSLLGQDLLVVRSDDDLAQAAKLMTEYKVSGMPVIDANDNLDGIISSSDVVRAYSEIETHFRLRKKDSHFV